MAEEALIQQEEADDQLINEAFQKLLDSYLSSRHRKKVDLITKAFNFARQAHKGVADYLVNHISCIPLLWHRLPVQK